jgi:tRNA-binding protein
MKVQSDNLASIHDFLTLDIRVGTILEALPFPKARKPAYRLKIDFGPLGIKKSSAQITDLYQLDHLIGRQVTAVVNFPPRQVADFISEVLVLGSVDSKGRVLLIRPDMPAENGDKIA